MKTISYDGQRYTIAYVDVENRVVVVNLPENEIHGYRSRMPLNFNRFTNRQRRMLQRS